MSGNAIYPISPDLSTPGTFGNISGTTFGTSVCGGLFCGGSTRMFFNLSERALELGRRCAGLITNHAFFGRNSVSRRLEDTMGQLPEGRPQPATGELVRVRSHMEILATLSPNKNRGWARCRNVICGKPTGSPFGGSHRCQ